LAQFKNKQLQINLGCPPVRNKQHLLPQIKPKKVWLEIYVLSSWILS